MRSLLTPATVFSAGLALVACGGGDDAVVVPPPTPTVTAVPDTAVASSQALVNFLYTQSFSDETSEPLTLPAGDLSTSETDEPIPLT